MVKRLLLLVLLAVGVLACLGLAVPALLPPKPGVTAENSRRLHSGMMKEEVDAILGGPGEASPFLNDMDRTRYWEGEHCRVSISSGSLTALDARAGELRTDDG